MKPPTSSVLDQLERRQCEEERRWSELSVEERRLRLGDFMLPIGREAGQLIHLLLQLQRGTRILELGTGIGYGTLWLADAARANGGRVVTVERSESKLAAAFGHFADAALLDVVEPRLADAVRFVEEAPGPWDFVVIDVWKEMYIPCFERLADKLAVGAVVVADNMHHPPEVRDVAEAYQRIVRGLAGFHSFDVAVGNGLEISRRMAPGQE